MTATPLRSGISEHALSTEELPRFVKGWVLDGQYRQLSKQTLSLRQCICDRLIWWLRREGHSDCGQQEIKGFLHYVTIGHLEPGGRYGNAKLTEPVGTRTVKDTHGILRS